MTPEELSKKIEFIQNNIGYINKASQAVNCLDPTDLNNIQAIMTYVCSLELYIKFCMKFLGEIENDWFIIRCNRYRRSKA